jgi:hypothetical protein
MGMMLELDEGVLEDLRLELADNMDADWEPGAIAPTPNRAMRLLLEIEGAMDKAVALKKAGVT